MAEMCALEFLWGLANNLNDILIKQFKKAFELGNLEVRLAHTVLRRVLPAVCQPSAASRTSRSSNRAASGLLFTTAVALAGRPGWSRRRCISATSSARRRPRFSLRARTTRPPSSGASRFTPPAALSHSEAVKPCVHHPVHFLGAWIIYRKWTGVRESDVAADGWPGALLFYPAAEVRGARRSVAERATGSRWEIHI
jgi:hypothetical protein